jgi:regulatory protein YycI of two-component signal transduction system YycFG
VTNQLVHTLQQYVSTSITQGEEDRLWQVVEHEVKRLHGGQSALTYMKTKNKKKQVFKHNMFCFAVWLPQWLCM